MDPFTTVVGVLICVACVGFGVRWFVKTMWPIRLVHPSEVDEEYWGI